MMKHLLHLLLLLPALMVACSSERKSDADRRIVTVSIEPQRWLLEQIAGDRFEVRSLMDKNADPENFDPTVAALRDVERSVAYFTLGHNAFEEATVERLRASGAAPEIVDTSVGVELLSGTHGGSHEGHDHGDEAVDPHLWQSVANMRQMAANMASALSRLDPDGATVYAARLDSLNSVLDSLDSRIRTMLDGAAGRSFLVWHPSLSYFARDYGLHQIALGIEGKETTPAAMARTLADARASGASVMILQPDDDPARSAHIARQAGARTAAVNTLSHDWPATMLALAAALRPR